MGNINSVMLSVLLVAWVQ